MKRVLFTLCLTTLVSPLFGAQKLTADERDKAVNYLEQTRTGVLEATRGLSKAQWNFKPATNRWSVAEITEHIAAAEEFLMGMVEDKVMKSPVGPEAGDARAVDELVMQKVPDRTNKAQAPEPLQPTNRYGTPKESLKHFKESRAKTIKYVKKTQDLRLHSADSPIGKPLDAYEWILFIAAHSERHTKQIKEVMADPNFPKM